MLEHGLDARGTKSSRRAKNRGISYAVDEVPKRGNEFPSAGSCALASPISGVQWTRSMSPICGARRTPSQSTNRTCNRTLREKVYGFCPNCPSAYDVLPSAYRLLPTAYCFPRSAFRLLPSDFCLPPAACRLPAIRFLPTGFRLPPTAYCLLLSAFCLPLSAFCQQPTAVSAPAGQVSKQASDLILQGFDLLSRHDAAGAEKAFRQAIEVQPEVEAAHRGLGLALREEGRLA